MLPKLSGFDAWIYKRVAKQFAACWLVNRHGHGCCTCLPGNCMSHMVGRHQGCCSLTRVTTTTQVEWSQLVPLKLVLRVATTTGIRSTPLHVTLVGLLLLIYLLYTVTGCCRLSSASGHEVYVRASCVAQPCSHPAMTRLPCQATLEARSPTSDSSNHNGSHCGRSPRGYSPDTCHGQPWDACSVGQWRRRSKWRRWWRRGVWLSIYLLVLWPR